MKLTSIIKLQLLSLALIPALSFGASSEHQMLEAIKKNDITNVKRLVDEGVPIPSGEYRYTPIDIAVRNNNPEMLSYLLASGANPVEDIEAMKAALSTCNMKMVSLLVDHGYKVKGNPSYYGPYDPLPWAAQFGCRDIVEYLVENGADVKSYRPLRLAASQCHVETVKYLLTKVQTPDLPDGDNRTPLWGAAITAVNWPDKRNACLVVINDLLQAGANPERAFLVPTENPALKLPRDDKEVMKLLRSKSGRS
jgi:ankyrin repeat protein